MNNIKINNFYNLETWKEGHKLVLEIYQLVKLFPANEVYGLVSQLRRASSSITANIAEGFSRYHFKDKIKFYYQARGSVAEVQNFLLLTKDLNLISLEKFQSLMLLTISVARLLNGFIRATDNQKVNC